MTPFTAHDIVRLVAAESRSALPNAPLVEPAATPSGARFGRVRLGLGATLRRLADRIEPRPVCQPEPAGH